MKEEQDNFAYDDLDRGSNKSFSSSGAEKASSSKMMLNMEQLVQNPGRASQGEESLGGKNRTKANIFAGKMRKPSPTEDKNSRNQTDEKMLGTGGCGNDQ